MTPVTRDEVEAAVVAYGTAVLCEKYPNQPATPGEAVRSLHSVITRLFAERDEAVDVLKFYADPMAHRVHVIGRVSCSPMLADHGQHAKEVLAKHAVTP